MQTRSQVMDKSSIIAILRTQAHLSYIQAHTAFYLLIRQDKLRTITPSGCFYVVTSPRRHYSWRELISANVNDKDFLKQFLSEDELFEQKLDESSFKQLINAYIDLKNCEGSVTQEYKKSDQGLTFINIDELPRWNKHTYGSSMQLTSVSDSVMAGSDCQQFDFGRKTMTLGYPVDVVDERIVPIFYVRIYDASILSNSIKLNSFEEDLIPKINESWFKLKFANKDHAAEEFKRRYKVCVDSLISEEADPMSNFLKADSWSCFKVLVETYFQPQQPLNIYNLSSLNSLRHDGIYNVALLGEFRENPFLKSIQHDLKNISRAQSQQLKNSVLPLFLYNSAPAVGIYPELVCTDRDKLPFNFEQQLAVASILDNRITVLQGPPGTGKTQVIAAAALNAAAQGKSVLITSYNHQAINALIERLQKIEHATDLTIRANSKEGTDATLYSVAMGLSKRTETTDASFNDIAKFNQLRTQLQEHLKRKDVVENLKTEIAHYDSCRDTMKNSFKHLATVFTQLEPQLTKFSSDHLQQCMQYFAQYCRCQDERSFFNLKNRITAFMTKLRLRISGGSVLTDALVKHSSNFKIINDYLLLSLRKNLCAEQLRTLSADADIEQLEADFAVQQKKLHDAYERAIRYCVWSSEHVCDNAKDWQNYLNELKQYAYSDAKQKDDFNDKLLTDADFCTHLSHKVKQILQHKPIWLCTTASARSLFPLIAGMFDLVIFDESSQFDFVAAIPLLYRAKAAAVIGDPNQLGPIVNAVSVSKQDSIMRNNGLEMNAVESRLWLCNAFPELGQDIKSLYAFAYLTPGAEKLSLIQSYRSCNRITQYISDLCYDGMLISRCSEADLPLPKHMEYGIKWYETADQTEKSSTNSSRSNAAEIKAVLELLHTIYADADFGGTVGILSPYKLQVDRIRQAVAADSLLAVHLQTAGDESVQQGLGDLTIQSVHQAQGSEWDIVILSLCLTSRFGNAFISGNKNILNVAVSRARSLVCVVGNTEAALMSDAEFIRTLPAVGGAEGSLDDDDDMALTESPLERLMLWHLKKLPLPKPKVQYPLPAINRRLDFAFIDEERKLFLDVEVDGNCHVDAMGQRKADDYLRDLQMGALHYEVLRFWGRKVYAEPAQCAQQVLDKWQQMMRDHDEIGF